MKLMTETEAVRSNSPELSAMTLPKLKAVAAQLGIEGAAKLKKEGLVEAISDLQAKNREAAKAEREARREARNNRKKETPAKNSAPESDDEDGDNESDSSSRRDRDRGRDRGRDRNRDRNRDRGPREEREPVISEDDVLVPVGGLLDILDSYAFIRTAGYLPGPNDV